LNTNLLRTKLFIPEHRPRYIIRPNLLTTLDNALNRKLTLVVGPPGYGKTTQLTVWIKDRNFPVAWYSLDAEDNDPQIFIRYLITALQGINPEIGQVPLALLKSTHTSSHISILSTLINDLSQVEQDFVVVFDDYHNIENQEIHESISYLLDHLPPRMHIILASRSDPPLPISRLRARNQLLEVRQVDLRLSKDETNQFLKDCMGLQLSEEQLSILEARTEGWFAGLQFAGLSLHRQKDIDVFLDSFSGSHRYVIDYLADEVFSTLSEDIRVFLSKIAILDRFTAPLCDTLTGRLDSQEILSQLEENSLFLIALDEQRRWYRFHHLFLGYLRMLPQGQSQAELHAVAASWFMQHDFYSEAVKHASASGDNSLLIAAIEGAAQGSFQRGEISLLNRWLDSLPLADLLKNSQLATFKGMITFFSVNPENAVPFLSAAEANLPQNPASALQGQVMSFHAHIALYQGDLDRSIRMAREALEYLDPVDLFFRNLTLNVLGQILEMKSDVVGAAEIYQQAFYSSQKADDQLGTLVIFTNLIFALNELGKRLQALEFCQEFTADLKWGKSPGLDLSDGVYLPWSLISYEADQLELAEEQVTRTLPGLDLVKVSQGKLWAQYILGNIYLAKGEFTKLSALTVQGRQLASKSGSNSVHYGWFELLDVQAQLMEGDLVAVERWAESKNFSDQNLPHHWFEQQYFTYIRMLIAQGKMAEAKQLLESLKTSIEADKRYRKLITVHLLLALVESGASQYEKAMQHLETALHLAEPQDYRRAFLNEGNALLDLLPSVRDVSPKFIDQLLSRPDSIPKQNLEVYQNYETLSEREADVLRLVARGYSNRQIADTLFVTLGTVKKHLNNIFGKLQVKNRTEAVVRARNLELID
jgi:LuxR family maltose regulon positive regulatory protein